jgi:cell division protein FtsB
MQVEAQDVIDALRRQREQNADQVAHLEAAVQGLRREVQALTEALEKLSKADPGPTSE